MAENSHTPSEDQCSIQLSYERVRLINEAFIYAHFYPAEVAFESRIYSANSLAIA
jgi:hypothetical protein